MTGIIGNLFDHLATLKCIFLLHFEFMVLDEWWLSMVYCGDWWVYLDRRLVFRKKDCPTTAR